MKACWDHSQTTETYRLLQATSNIANGFYQHHNFWVTTVKHGLNKTNSVILPKINFASIPGFWRKVSTIKHDSYPPQVNPSLFLATSKLTPKTKQIINLQKKWHTYEDRILTAIHQIIPRHSQYIKSLTIWPTHYGTTCSFSVNIPDIKIWIRTDQGITQIVEAILSSLTRNTVVKNLKGTWSESEAIVDWLLTDSPLAELLKQIDPKHAHKKTLSSTRSHELNHKQIQLQDQLFANIGFKNQIATLTSSTLPASLNQSESEIMKLLIMSKPNPVTFDQIGNLIWANPEENYSLTAISKHIERLRRKLELSGLPANSIQTWRTKGYLLRN